MQGAFLKKIDWRLETTAYFFAGTTPIYDANKG